MQVSRAAQQLDEVLAIWRKRHVGEIIYLYLDARYEKVRRDGQIQDAAILMAAGVGRDGKRRVLGVSVALSEAEQHWILFSDSLKEVRSITEDWLEEYNAIRPHEVLGGVPPY